MDGSNPTSSNTSAGFVYFNTTPNQADTAEFLAFSDSPQASPQPNKFKPAYYSSPQTKFYRGSPRNYPQNNRKYQRWSGGSRSFNSSNNSSFNSFNQSTSFKESGTNITKFIHPSFLEDPWAPLEAKLKEQTRNSSELDDSTSSGSQET